MTSTLKGTAVPPIDKTAFFDGQDVTGEIFRDAYSEADANDQTASTRVSVSATDTHVKTLDDALVAGDGISITKQNGGADESLLIEANLSATDIPNLDASKITAGTLDGARIPNLDADKITSGTLDGARIPNLDADKITSGTLDAGRIPNLDADKITAGTLDEARLPGITATMIDSGANSAGLVMTTDGLGGASWEAPTGGGGGGGGVSSVGLALPSEFTVTGSPVVTTGTLTGAWASQTANRVLASPDGSSGAPAFRALVAGDVPNISASKLTSGTTTANITANQFIPNGQTSGDGVGMALNSQSSPSFGLRANAFDGLASNIRWRQGGADGNLIEWVWSAFDSTNQAISINPSAMAIRGASRLAFFTGATIGATSERVRITDTGNVGINTTSPSERLTVSGNVSATKFIGTVDSGAAPAGHVLTADGTGGSAFTASGGGGISVAYLTHERPSGTSGGSLASGDWRTMTLNEKRYDPDGIVTLSNNVMTLGAGNYVLYATSVFRQSSASGNGAMRLRDTGASVTLGYKNGHSTIVNTDISLFTAFTVATTATLELQFNGSTVSNGVAQSTGEPEVYTNIIIMKVG